MTRLFRELVAASGLPPVTLHGLRHGAAALALAARTDLKVVQDQLGHSTIVLTADTYTSVLRKPPAPPLSAPPRSCFPPSTRLRQSLRPGGHASGRSRRGREQAARGQNRAADRKASLSANRLRC